MILDSTREKGLKKQDARRGDAAKVFFLNLRYYPEKKNLTYYVINIKFYRISLTLLYYHSITYI